MTTGDSTTTGWQPIKTYPRTLDTSTGAWWGREVVVRFQERMRYVAHLEADMWLTRSGEDTTAWSELADLPTHWVPLPEDGINDD